MRPATTKVIGLALVVACTGALGASVYQLSRTLEDRNVKTVRFVGAIPGERFTFQGHEGRVELIPPDAKGADPTLRLTWRADTADFPVAFADKPGEEGLKRFEDWFSISMLVDGEESESALREKWATDERGEPMIVPRLVVAARYPAPGAEGLERSTWGLVRRQEWEYRIGELRIDGPPADAIDLRTMNYEQLDALHLPGKYTEKKYLLPEGERDAMLWMYYAMQTVTPAAQYRGRNKSQTDVVRSMGWAWPVAVGSTLGLVGGIALFASAGVTRPGA